MCESCNNSKDALIELEKPTPRVIFRLYKKNKSYYKSKDKCRWNLKILIKYVNHISQIQPSISRYRIDSYSDISNHQKKNMNEL